MIPMQVPKAVRTWPRKARRRYERTLCRIVERYVWRSMEVFIDGELFRGVSNISWKANRETSDIAAGRIDGEFTIGRRM